MSALAAFDRAIACDPEDAEAHYNRGTLHAEEGQTAAAIADFDETVRLKSGFRDAHYNRGVLLLRTGRLAEARADIETFCRLGGQPPAALLKLVGLANQP